MCVSLMSDPASDSPFRICLHVSGSGYVSRPQINATANVLLTFAIDPSCSVCSSHPLYITDSSVGGGVGTVLAGGSSGITSGESGVESEREMAREGE